MRRFHTATRLRRPGFFSSVRLALAPSPREQRENADNPYIQYPVVTQAQMLGLLTDKFKLKTGHASFAHHSSEPAPIVHSLSDLSDPTLLNLLLPRRRPQGSPADTLSIKAGDDAMLVLPTLMAVADGVSGWELKGEQCSLGIWLRLMVETLSRLMTEYKLNHTPHNLKKRDIDQILDDLYLHTLHLMDLQGLRGLLTLILGMLSGASLKMISIGDLKLYVVRGGDIIKTNEEQMVSDLCPQQIGTQTLDVMPSEVAWVDAVRLEHNDIVIMCSDGVLDNLYDWELLQLLDEHMHFKKGDVRVLASKIIQKAKQVAYDDNAYTPYNEKVGRITRGVSLGGKLDDMSVCVGRVVPNT